MGVSGFGGAEVKSVNTTVEFGVKVAHADVRWADGAGVAEPIHGEEVVVTTKDHVTITSIIEPDGSNGALDQLDGSIIKEFETIASNTSDLTASKGSVRTNDGLTFVSIFDDVAIDVFDLAEIESIRRRLPDMVEVFGSMERGKGADTGERRFGRNTNDLGFGNIERASKDQRSVIGADFTDTISTEVESRALANARGSIVDVTNIFNAVLPNT